MAKRRKGRPNLPNEKVRRLSVHILVTPAEHKLIKKAAAAADMSMSSWARERLLAGLR
jgi:hypothetical protein